MAEGFYIPIKGQVVTFAVSRKTIKVGEVAVIDQEAIYARVIGLMVSQRDIDFHTVLNCELAPYPSSMFYSDESLRIATGKYRLKQSLAGTTSVSEWGEPSVLVVDVSAVLWTLHWPTCGTVHNPVKSFEMWIQQRMASSDEHLVFDRSYDLSTKSSTRRGRAGNTAHTRVHKLSLSTPLPSRYSVLKCVANKTQLNHLITEAILEDDCFIAKVTTHRDLYVTRNTPVPTVVHRGETRAEPERKSSHEEADVTLVKHAIWSCERQHSRVCIVLDDTDVFVLLCHHYH